MMIRNLAVAFALLLLCVNLHAQTSLTFKGGTFRDNNGSKLSDADMLKLTGPEIYYDTYLGAMKQFKAGKSLTYSGIGVMTAGLVALFAGVYNGYEMLGYSGQILAFAGGAMIDVGVPLWSIGKSRLRWIESDYNKRHSPSPVEFSLNVGRNGFGLAMKF